MTQSFSPLTSWHIYQARSALRHGQVIAYPTEAVWGLGCDPWDEGAVKQVLELKERPAHKGLILVAGSLDQVRFLLDPLPAELQARAREHWPGPVTCLLPDVQDQVPRLVKGQHESIAVRVSAHGVVRALCQAAGRPLVSTSCNPAGHEPARRSWQVRRYFSPEEVHLVPGAVGGARNPSRILDIMTGQWLR
ncbi:L-threonylcarbamoyladenylate synthase [Marinobacter salicampi]|uniref:L-threonylcarbamoyladenylate synthase n=1 Tax=Marinobacter salicampi TaxID=435907 RepID=UPI00140C1CDD|nr:Sua5/YciO/YrdC/YwlC family protein [Marinobacter salicampi]